MTVALPYSDLFMTEPARYELTATQALRRSMPAFSSLSATDWRPMAHGALKSIEQECGVDNWDGPGSKRVAILALSAARLMIEQLYKQLPRTIPCPDIAPEADGEIDFSWYDKDGLSVSMSVSARGTVTYAANYGRKGVDHGWKSLDEALETVVRLVVRLFPTSVGRGHT